MSAKNAVGFQRLTRRTAPNAAFVGSYGADTKRSYSMSPANRAGTAYIEVPEGQILALYRPDGLHYPMAYAAALEAVAAANVVKVADARQFFVGDYVELPESVADDATRFRAVTGVDLVNNEITLDGAAFTISEGAALEVDPSRSFDACAGDQGAGAASVTVTDATRFEVGDVIDVGTNKDLTVSAIDAGTNTLTVSSAITYADGDLVVSGPDGGYKIMSDGARTGTYEHTYQNVLAETRRVGEVRESVLVGLTPTARAALEGSVEFNDAI